MKIENAIKKLNKSGFVFAGKSDGKIRQNQTYVKPGCRYVVSFLVTWYGDNDSDVSMILVRNNNDQSDGREDYFAGSFVPTLTQAIKYANAA